MPPFHEQTGKRFNPEIPASNTDPTKIAVGYKRIIKFLAVVIGQYISIIARVVIITPIINVE